MRTLSTRGAASPELTPAAVSAAALALGLLGVSLLALAPGSALAGGNALAARSSPADATSAATSVEGPNGLLVTLNPQSGRYEVRSRQAGWTFAGTLDAPERLTATVMFAPDDPAVRLLGYATHEPTVTAIEGTVGQVTFAPRSGRFTAVVSPGAAQLREGRGDDPVRRAIVAFDRGER